ncbi:MAG: hypothetical protein Q7S27_00940 [Nanoarchaeota archaeon]|nr:hypothetical protein [Nanoarchaeota archaeon]
MSNIQKMLLFAIILLVFIALTFLLYSGQLDLSGQVIEDSKQITISEDNFVYLGAEGSPLFKNNCEEIRSGNCDFLGKDTESCNLGTTFFRYKLVNMPEEIYSTAYSNVYCTATSNGKALYLDLIYPSGEHRKVYTQKLSYDESNVGDFYFPLDVNTNHNVVVCCKVDGTYFPPNSDFGISLKSNEVCLSPIKVKNIC